MLSIQIINDWRHHMKQERLPILTFDVEDWFHILDHPPTRYPNSWSKFESRLEHGVDRLLDHCNTAGLSATFFILGWVAQRYPTLVRRIAECGHEIGCHSFSHQLIHHQTRTEFRKDLNSALNHIAAATGNKPKLYRAPGFSITKECIWAFDIMQEAGIEIDCSIFPAGHSHGGIKIGGINGPCLIDRGHGNYLKEFPMSYYEIFNWKIPFSGGGYFRLMPFWISAQLFKRSSYAMTYFHPRDFDADQPPIPDLRGIRSWRSNVGIKTASSKLRDLLSRIDFMTVGEASRLTDWSKAPKINLFENKIVGEI